MTRRHPRAFTLVELLMAVSIVALVAGAATALLATCLQAFEVGSSRSSLYREGIVAMERMTAGARRASWILVPNGQAPSRAMLAFSGDVNDDGDFYFGDTRFPRIDEDPPADMTQDGEPGIRTLDDDGDGQIDDPAGGTGDDDEDGAADEDPVNGLDDDGDGSIDEDPGADLQGDGQAGLAGIDDDGDGSIDEGAADDDDEDGVVGEDPLNPVVFEFDGAGVLTESRPGEGSQMVLSVRVAAFEVVYEAADATHHARIEITLTLRDADGETLTLREHVYPRNVDQRWGRRVR